MRLIVLILLGFLLISFASANNHSSSTDTRFNILGCNFNTGTEMISVVAGTCSGGAEIGRFFCDSNSVGWLTNETGLGCSRGSNEYSSGDGSCCPPGYFCNQTVFEAGNGQFQCARRMNNCGDQLNEINCRGLDCIWLNSTNTCADGYGDLSCEYYNTNSSCIADEYDLGKNSIGTELCGTIAKCQSEPFSVPESGCSCQWYDLAPAGEKCQVKLIGVQTFYNATPNKFECSNSYNVGNCVDGKQNVSWTSNSSIISGNWSSIPGDCLDALRCDGGETTRNCGGPIIKLPGFSLFSLFASFGIIGLYYFLRKDLNKKDS